MEHSSRTEGKRGGCSSHVCREVLSPLGRYLSAQQVLFPSTLPGNHLKLRRFSHFVAFPISHIKQGRMRHQEPSSTCTCASSRLAVYFHRNKGMQLLTSCTPASPSTASCMWKQRAVYPGNSPAHRARGGYSLQIPLVHTPPRNRHCWYQTTLPKARHREAALCDGTQQHPASLLVPQQSTSCSQPRDSCSPGGAGTTDSALQTWQPTWEPTEAGWASWSHQNCFGSGPRSLRNWK